jgi:hypothetical protein
VTGASSTATLIVRENLHRVRLTGLADLAIPIKSTCFYINMARIVSTLNCYVLETCKIRSNVPPLRASFRQYLFRYKLRLKYSSQFQLPLSLSVYLINILVKYHSNYLKALAVKRQLSDTNVTDGQANCILQDRLVCSLQRC